MGIVITEKNAFKYFYLSMDIWSSCSILFINLFKILTDWALVCLIFNLAISCNK